MHKITFTCETITPMFLAGADGSTPELRAPSIKGALRFWWRALNGHLSLKELKEQEGEIFGNTEQRSRVMIRVLQKQLDTKLQQVLVHRDSGFRKEAFTEKQAFDIVLGMPKELELEIKNLFVLVCALGGFGNRCRRGFGSITIKKIKEDTGFLFPTTLETLYRFLKPENYKLINNKIISINQKGSKYPYIKEIEIGKASATILKKIGETTHEVNKEAGWDYGLSLGQAHGGRFASPIYVSTLTTLRGLCPIITTLNTVPPKLPHKVQPKLQASFKNKILY